MQRFSFVLFSKSCLILKPLCFKSNLTNRTVTLIKLTTNYNHRNSFIMFIAYNSFSGVEWYTKINGTRKFVNVKRYSKEEVTITRLEEHKALILERISLPDDEKH